MKLWGGFFDRTDAEITQRSGAQIVFSAFPLRSLRLCGESDAANSGGDR